MAFRLELNDGAHGSTVALFFCTRRRRGSVAQRGAAVAGRPSAFPVAGLMAATPPTSTDADPQSRARESVVMAAMAWRVKYRKAGAEQEVAKLKHRIENLCVRPENRGSVYPAGLRCKSLRANVLDGGFSKEEFCHQLVAVEEAPPEQIRSRGPDYQSGAAHNKAASAKDEYLCTCFNDPYGDPRLMLLAHNRMRLILRAFLTRAKWELPPNLEKNLAFCDADGRLSTAAVAESENGKQLSEVLHEGCDVEVLAWEMDVEEPFAAAVISRALQKGHELSLRTTELSALATLKGEIIRQLGKDVSQRVAYQTVRDRVQLQLDSAAEDPDLPEVFDFLINAGVGQNAYVTDLQDFAGCFADSKKRQLRFSAFGVVNKIKEQAPLTKIAVLKRAYRKKPSLGFCPNPEPAWAAFSLAALQPLEGLLRFFHSACKSSLEKLPPQSRLKHLANIDHAAAETFFIASTESQKKKTPRSRFVISRRSCKLRRPSISNLST